MEITITKDKLIQLLKQQVKNMYYLDKKEYVMINLYIDEALKRVEQCFSGNKNKYYWKKNPWGGGITVVFNPLHTCQYTIFLYYLANTVWRKTKNSALCNKLYGLVKIISSADLFYEIELPDIFSCEHPVGSVMGRAKYNDYFLFYHGCTVGVNKGKYPIIGKRVTMYSNSKILGDCKIGDNVVISANTYVKDQDVPNDSIVFGQSPNLVIKKVKQS